MNQLRNYFSHKSTDPTEQPKHPEQLGNGEPPEQQLDSTEKPGQSPDNANGEHTFSLDVEVVTIKTAVKEEELSEDGEDV